MDSEGRKHPLVLWEGTTENKALCSALLGDLIDRRLDASRPVLFVIDGGKGIRSAIRAVYGELAPVQRCRAHKERNVTDHLSQREGTFVARKFRAAWAKTDAGQAERELRALARRNSTVIGTCSRTGGTYGVHEIGSSSLLQ